MTAKKTVKPKTNKKKQKQKAIGLISKKKTTLHVQHTFFVHFFAVVLQDDNVKLPETSQLRGPVHFFLPPLFFTWVTASISHFLTAAIKFLCYSSNKIGLLCLSLALAFSLLSTPM